MKLVENIPRYYEFIRELRNNKSVKKGFIQQDHIGYQSHQLHMQQYAGCYYICLIDDKPVGYVGNIKEDYRVATLPQYQGQGIGTFMVCELMSKFPNAVAKVKIENIASLRLFEKCGFKKKYYILEKE